AIGFTGSGCPRRTFTSDVRHARRTFKRLDSRPVLHSSLDLVFTGHTSILDLVSKSVIVRFFKIQDYSSQKTALMSENYFLNKSRLLVNTSSYLRP
ncbi:hypothetical protein NOL04_09205, partial [Streptococcus suis]|nr:hypothetical protein [Streptococcus suis]